MKLEVDWIRRRHPKRTKVVNFTGVFRVLEGGKERLARRTRRTDSRRAVLSEEGKHIVYEAKMGGAE